MAKISKTSNKKILIIDDDVDLLSALVATVEAFGYEVKSANNSVDGLKLFDSEKPDLVFCDIMMEKIDSGIRAVGEMRKKNAKVPIYLLSDIGYATGDNVDITSLGCNGALQKPYKPDELQKMLKQIFGK